MRRRVIIADDHAILRDGLRVLLEKELGFEVVGEAGDGKQAIQLVREQVPDLLVLDINMPGMNGIEAARTILQELPKIKIISLSMHREKRYVIQMFEIGVSGYLLKDSAFSELADAIQTVLANRRYVSPAIGAEVIQDCLTRLATAGGSTQSALTPREREVLQLLAEGNTNNQIAAYINISAKTVDNHRQRIMRKLNLHTIADLTKYAVREGLTSLD